MASTNILDLTPEMQSLYKKFEAAMKAERLTFKVTCTARTYEEQVALYAQGRQSLDEVNRLRKIAGLYLLTPDENKRKITWTLNSKHIIDKSKGILKARAFDIVLVTDGRANLDIKVDVDKDLVPDYKEAAAIGKAVGLRPGAYFKTPDFPHFEISNV